MWKSHKTKVAEHSWLRLRCGSSQIKFYTLLWCPAAGPTARGASPRQSYLAETWQGELDAQREVKTYYGLIQNGFCLDIATGLDAAAG